MRIAVCDDDRYYVEHIGSLVKRELEQCTIFDADIALYTSGQEVINDEMQMHNLDVVFLDINMPHESGMEIARQLSILNPAIILVFITSYIDFAPESFRINALRYILKDDLEHNLGEAVEAVLNRMHHDKLSLPFEFTEGKENIKLSELLYIESYRHNMMFHVLHQTEHIYRLQTTMDDLEKRLTPYHFIRVHKGYLVNYHHIYSLKNYILILDNGVKIQIPHERFKRVREEYKELWGRLQ